MKRLLYAVIRALTLRGLYLGFVFWNLRWQPAGNLSAILPNGKEYAFRFLLSDLPKIVVDSHEIAKLNADAFHLVTNIDQICLGVSTEGAGKLYGVVSFKSAVSVPQFKPAEDGKTGTTISLRGKSRTIPHLKTRRRYVRFLPFYELYAGLTNQVLVVGAYHGLFLVSNDPSALQEMLIMWDRLPARDMAPCPLQTDLYPKSVGAKLVQELAKLKAGAPKTDGGSAVLGPALVSSLLENSGLLDIESLRMTVSRVKPIAAQIQATMPTKRGVLNYLPVEGDLEYPEGFPLHPESFFQANLAPEVWDEKLSGLGTLNPAGIEALSRTLSVLNGLTTGRISHFSIGQQWLIALDLIQTGNPDLIQKLKQARERKGVNLTLASYQDQPVLLEKSGARYMLLGYKGRQILLSNDWDLFKQVHGSEERHLFQAALGFPVPATGNRIGLFLTPEGKRASVLMIQHGPQYALDVNEQP